MKDFRELFLNELKNLYNAEEKLAKALPEISNNISSKKLKAAFQDQLEETQEQLRRLETIARELNQELTGGEAVVMGTFIKEGERLAELDYDPMVKDAALIAWLQQIDHFEIAIYGVLRSYARNLKMKNVEELLNLTIHEKGREDRKLTEIAEGSLFSSGVNTQASKRKAA